MKRLIGKFIPRRETILAFDLQKCFRARSPQSPFLIEEIPLAY